jgi:redox-sensitive bicupin YhaK (pirin superfamily)
MKNLISYRTLKRVHPAHRDDIADLTTRRPLPSASLPHLNPFLFLNHHGPQVYAPHNGGLPFGPHPHRGFETVTFVLDGSLAHSDTGGHESVIDAGGIQWMTAGSGLIHAELSPQTFMERGGSLEILQLWLNLPARLKMTAPRYIGVQRESIPVVISADGRARVKLVSGEWQGARGPVDSLTNAFMSMVEMDAGGTVSFDRLEHRQVFLYVVSGAVQIQGKPVRQFNLAELDAPGDVLELSATTPTVLLFGHADFIDEPIAAGGPFVMNTQEELRQAVADYHAGKFNVSPD